MGKNRAARHPQRPYPMDFIERIFTDFSEIHGDRAFGDDEAVACGMARSNGEEVMVIGNRKGGTTKERVKRNFGMPNPEGYRKALRVHAASRRSFRGPSSASSICRAHIPALGPKSAARPKPSRAISARCRACAFPPSRSSAAKADRAGRWRWPSAIACSFWRTRCTSSSRRSRARPSCGATPARSSWPRKPCASPLRKWPQLGCVDEIICEPPGGAHTDHEAGAGLLGQALTRHLNELKAVPVEELVARRQQKFRNIAQFYTEGS